MAESIKLVYGLTCCCILVFLCLSLNLGVMMSYPQNSCRCTVPVGVSVIGPQADVTETETATATTKTVSNRSTVFSRTLLHGKGINFDIVQYFTMAPDESKDPFVNQHQYNYTLNSKVCAGRKLFLMMLIHSAPGHIRKRIKIRNTFGTVKTYKDKEIATVFLLAVPQDQTDQIIINMESKRYNDIVQGKFLDVYKNLNSKHIMAMHWFKENCAAEYILKLDDDTFVNPYRTVEYLLDKPPVGKTMHCYVISNEMPVRNSRSKWYTPKSQYPFAMFPPFCIGFAYLTTPQTWSAMLRVSGSSRKMDMDDVFVSVVLAIKAAVTKVDFRNRLYYCTGNTMIDVQRLNTKILVIDRYRKCESRLFHDDNWKKLRDMNK